MDQAAKALDVKYQEIIEAEKKIQLHREAVRMLQETGLSTNAVAEHVARHEQIADELQREVNAKRREQLDEFMAIENLEQLRILNMRYLEDLTWEQITQKTGCTKRWVMLVRDRALKEITEAKN